MQTAFKREKPLTPCWILSLFWPNLFSLSLHRISPTRRFCSSPARPASVDEAVRRHSVVVFLPSRKGRELLWSSTHRAILPRMSLPLSPALSPARPACHPHPLHLLPFSFFLSKIPRRNTSVPPLLAWRRRSRPPRVKPRAPGDPRRCPLLPRPGNRTRTSPIGHNSPFPSLRPPAFLAKIGDHRPPPTKPSAPRVFRTSSTAALRRPPSSGVASS